MQNTGDLKFILLKPAVDFSAKTTILAKCRGDGLELEATGTAHGLYALKVWM